MPAVSAWGASYGQACPPAPTVCAPYAGAQYAAYPMSSPFRVAQFAGSGLGWFAGW
jgi:hypothetical protein